jgi:Gas vesicle synthesis protein GvpL/GvpF
LKLPTTRIAEHIYVYAAVEGTTSALPSIAMPDGEAPRLIAASPQLSIVVSTVPAATYNASSLEPRLSDLDWVSVAGAAHHAVVDALADGGLAVLPFRLFTIFSSEKQALSTIRERLPAMLRGFDRVRGRHEWVLHIGRPDPARRARANASAATSGTGFLAAKAVQRREEAARAERVQQHAAAAYQVLQRLAVEATMREVDPRGRLILDAAFLLEPAQVDELKQALTEAAGHLLRDGCPVSLTGPWPPYSFASVDTNADA